VKTRTLLLLAVSCGLIILIAGSIKLFLVADAEVSPRLAVGTTATVGGMTIIVKSFEQVNGFAVATVTMFGIDDPYGATLWKFGTGKEPLAPLKQPLTSLGEPCLATKKVEPTTCVLVFDSASAQGVLRYQRDSDMQLWDILEPAK
jgi:hypothetical protein